MNLSLKTLRIVFVFLIMFLGVHSINAQKINWMTFEEVADKLKENPKKIMIDIYTDWCRFCKVMDENTFANPVIAQYINDNYYAVKFNAESTQKIEFAGHSFENKKEGSRPVHELAIALTQGKLSYPTYVFMNEKTQIIHVQAGYVEPKLFEPMIAYISEGIYEKDIAYDVFISSFQSKLK